MKKFLILGCHRSGTTLLRFILGAHPDIYCLGEVSACQKFATQENIQVDVELIGYQLSSMIEEIPFACPDKLPIVVIDRDPVDIIASMMKLNIDNLNMLNDYIVPWVQYREKHNALFYEVFKEEIHRWTELNPQSEEYILKAAVLHHKWVNYLIDCYEKMDYPIFRINYDDLVTRTEKVTKNICQFLGVEWNSQMLNHTTYDNHSDILPNGLTIGNNDYQKPVSSESIGKGHRYFDKKQIEVIQSD